MSSSAEKVLQNHFQAARDSVDAVMQDFADASVLITHDATYRGLAEIRQFFTTLLDGLPEGFFDAFKMNRQEVVGEFAYTIWEAKPWLPLATDTFVAGTERFCFRHLRRAGLRKTDGIAPRRIR